jgi:hypothetical protein
MLGWKLIECFPFYDNLMINAIKFIIKVFSRVILKFRDAWLEKPEETE